MSSKVSQPSTLPEETAGPAKESFILDASHNAFSNSSKLAKQRQVLSTLIVCVGCVASGLAIGMTGGAGNAMLHVSSPEHVFDVNRSIPHSMTVNNTFLDNNDSLATTTTRNFPESTKNADILEENNDLSWLASSFLLGGSLGVLLFQLLVERIGFRRVFLAFVLPLLAFGNVLLLASSHLGVIIIARVLMGLGVSLQTLASSSFVRETSTDDMVGILGWFLQWATSFGIFLSFTLVLFVSWPLLVWFSLLLLLFFGAIVFWVLPESPAWLIGKGKEYSATKSLKWLHGSKESLESKIEHLRRQLALERRRSHALTNVKGHYLKLAIAIILVIVLQFSGFPVLLFYADHLLYKTGLGHQSPILALMGLTLLASSIIAPFLVQRFNAKLATTSSLLIMGLCQVAIGALLHEQSELYPSHLDYTNNYYNESKSYVNNSVENEEIEIGEYSVEPQWLVVPFMLCSLVTFNFGFGTLVWLLVSKCFLLPRFKHIMTLLTFIFFISGLVVVGTHNGIVESAGPMLAFGCYGLVCLLGAITVISGLGRILITAAEEETSIKSVVGEAGKGVNV